MTLGIGSVVGEECDVVGNIPFGMLTNLSGTLQQVRKSHIPPGYPPLRDIMASVITQFGDFDLDVCFADLAAGTFMRTGYPLAVRLQDDSPPEPPPPPPGNTLTVHGCLCVGFVEHAAPTWAFVDCQLSPTTGLPVQYICQELQLAVGSSPTVVEPTAHSHAGSVTLSFSVPAIAPGSPTAPFPGAFVDITWHATCTSGSMTHTRRVDLSGGGATSIQIGSGCCHHPCTCFYFDSAYAPGGSGCPTHECTGVGDSCCWCTVPPWGATCPSGIRCVQLACPQYILNLRVGMAFTAFPPSACTQFT